MSVRPPRGSIVPILTAVMLVVVIGLVGLGRHIDDHQRSQTNKVIVNQQQIIRNEADILANQRIIIDHLIPTTTVAT